MNFLASLLTPVLIFATLSFPSSVPAQDISALKPAVVRIENNRLNEVGTGFIVKIDGNQVYIVTAAHVVKGDQHPRIYLFNQQHDSLRAEVLDREDDDIKGLALLRLKVSGHLASGLTALKLSSTKHLSGGEDINVIGFPDSTAFWTVGRGSIARIEGRNLVFSGAIRGGNSGGPVILNGLVIGMVTDMRQSSTYATRGEAIEPYVNGIVKNLVVISEPIYPKEAPLLDVATAISLLDRAIKAKDNSIQGQVAAIEMLLKKGFIFKNTSLKGVSLAGAKMHESDFSSSGFVAGDLSNAEFDRGNLDSADLDFANLQNTSFRRANAEGAYFQYTYADQAKFEGATLNRSSFFLSRLRGANFRNAKLRGACLAFCDLTGADFTGADLTDAIIISSVLDNAKFEGAIINNTDVGGSVANTISFTLEQRKELRRSSQLVNYPDIRLWGTAGSNVSYPNYISFETKLVKIPRKLSRTLKFRNDNALSPVGPFKNYSRQGPNDIHYFQRYESGFWETASRYRHIKKRLEDYGDFLFEQISNQPLIEGSNLDLKAWMSFIETNSQIISFSGPLVWTNDAYMTLLLSKGMISLKDIDEHNWKALAIERCSQDAERSTNVRWDSWKPIYPLGTMCNMLPPSHVEAYKKWTMARSKQLSFQQIEVVYTVKLNDLERARKVRIDDILPGERLRIFDHLENANEYLDNSMVVSSSRYENPEFLLGLPTRARIGYALLRLPATRSRYSIEKSLDLTMLLMTGPRLDDASLQLRVVFDLVRITIKDGTYEFAAIPKKAKLEMDGNQIWEGAIVLLSDRN